jgi:hypothetical protein
VVAVKRSAEVFGFRFDRYRWVHVVLASGTVGGGGCVDRAFHFGYVGPDSEGDTEVTTGDTTGTPDTTNPSDPTVDPTDPTGTLPGVPGPPQLLEVRFIDNITLELRFNEPMAPPGGVDPTQFRLSLGFAQSYDYGTFTVYQEIGQFNGGENCYEYCYDPCNYDYDTGCETDGRMCYENCYPVGGPPVRSFSIRLDPSYDDRIQLGLDQGIASGVCNAIMNVPQNSESGLFLHFTDDFVPVADAQGESLQPIGERWALLPDEYFYYRPEAFFPDLVPFLPIACPF